MIVDVAGSTIDLGRVEIRRDDEVVLVQPLVFSLIEYLIAQRDRVVSKEELLDNVWGDRFVSETALTSSIKLARRALGDDGQRQEVIKTVHGRGYRLTADVETVSDVEDDDAAPEPASEAVLPVGSATRTTEATGAAERTRAPTPEAWPFVGRHELVEDLVATVQSGHSVVLEGPRGSGKSRTLHQLSYELEWSDRTVVWLRGVAATRTVPLGALAPLVDATVLDAPGQTGEMSEGELFRRALDSLRELIGDAGVLLIDDVEHLDAFTLAVVSSLIVRDGVAAAMAHTPSSESPVELVDLVKSLSVRTIRLPPLNETDLDVLIYIALDGPIDDTSGRTITAASRGRPGALADVIDATRASGGLRLDRGTWRLTDGPISSRSSSWPTAGLGPGAIEAAERLSILPPVPVSTAELLLDLDDLHELDRAQLIGITPDGTYLGLDDPLVAAGVARSIGPLRLRTMKQEMVATLDPLPGDPVLAARLVEWRLELALPVDANRAVEIAWRALLADDAGAAETLIRGIDRTNDASAQLLAAELAFGRSQWDEAMRLYDAVDEASLDDISLALLYRRRATLAVEQRSDTDQPDTLERLASTSSPFVASALHARRLGLLATLGHLGQVEADAAQNEPAGGVGRIEWLISVGSAGLGRGRFDELDTYWDEALALLPAVPKVWRQASRDGILTLKCAALWQRGDLDGAAEMIRAELPAGRRTSLGFLPAIAADVELESGRLRSAREFVRASISTSRRNDFAQYLRLCQVLDARAGHRLGETGVLRRGLEAGESALHEIAGVLRWRIAISWGELMYLDGRGPASIPKLLDLAREAEVSGAHVAECDMLTRAACNDPTGETARIVAPRLNEVAREFDGRFWPIRLAENAARGAQRSLNEVADRYAELGYHLRADSCRAVETA